MTAADFRTISATVEKLEQYHLGQPASPHDVALQPFPWARPGQVPPMPSWTSSLRWRRFCCPTTPTLGTGTCLTGFAYTEPTTWPARKRTAHKYTT